MDNPPETAPIPQQNAPVRRTTRKRLRVVRKGRREHPFGIKEPLTPEIASALRNALEEAEIAGLRAADQARRNIIHLQECRLEIQTAREIIAASNRFSESHYGESQ